VRRFELAAPLGSRVRPLVHNANLLGYAVFECARPEEYGRLAQAVLNALELEVVRDGFA